MHEIMAKYSNRITLKSWLTLTSIYAVGAPNRHMLVRSNYKQIKMFVCYIYLKQKQVEVFVITKLHYFRSNKAKCLPLRFMGWGDFKTYYM